MHFLRHFFHHSKKQKNDPESKRGVEDPEGTQPPTSTVDTPVEAPHVPEFIIYPLWAKQLESSTSTNFSFHLHGVVLLRAKENESSLRIKMVETLLGKLSDPNESDEQKQKLHDRLSWFFAQSVENRHILKLVLKLPGGKTLELVQDEKVKTDDQGHFNLDFDVNIPELKVGETYCYEIHLDKCTSGPGAVGEGRFQVVGFEGFSIISDVDDTVKDTRVLEFKEMVRRAFLQIYKPIPDMNTMYAALAQRLAKESNSPFATHFLSASPYAILPSLDQFFTEAAFPPFMVQAASFSFRHLSSLKPDLKKYKSEGIKYIMQNFPRRKFIIFGDSGQLDPEAFAEVVRDYQSTSITPDKWPEQIVGIFIREVVGDIPKLTFLNTSLRFQHAFKGLDARRWRVFKDPNELLNLNLIEGEVWKKDEVNSYAVPAIENLEELIQQETYSYKAKKAFSGIKDFFVSTEPPVDASAGENNVVAMASPPASSAPSSAAVACSDVPLSAPPSAPPSVPPKDAPSAPPVPAKNEPAAPPASAKKESAPPTPAAPTPPTAPPASAKKEPAPTSPAAPPASTKKESAPPTPAAPTPAAAPPASAKKESAPPTPAAPTPAATLPASAKKESAPPTPAAPTPAAALPASAKKESAPPTPAAPTPAAAPPASAKNEPAASTKVVAQTITEVVKESIEVTTTAPPSKK